MCPVRLTPLVLGVMLLWLYVVPHLGSGPVWYRTQQRTSCFNYWWTNLLYIQNFYPIQYGDIVSKLTGILYQILDNSLVIFFKKETYGGSKWYFINSSVRYIGDHVPSPLHQTSTDEFLYPDFGQWSSGL